MTAEAHSVCVTKMQSEYKTMENENLKLWNAVEKTNPEYTSNASISGRTITSIDAYVQIKEATEQFGSYGSKWGLKDTSLEYKEIGDTILAIYKATFWYPDGEFPIYNSIKLSYKTKGDNGYIKIDEDFAKKVETNTVTKALSKLGFNTDVFMGKFEDAMYVEDLQDEFAEEKLEQYKSKLEKAETLEKLAKAFSGLPPAVKKQLEGLKDELKAKLSKNENK